MNPLRELLSDLALEAQNALQELQEKDKNLVGITKITDAIVEDYLQQLKKIIKETA